MHVQRSGFACGMPIGRERRWQHERNRAQRCGTCIGAKRNHPLFSPDKDPPEECTQHRNSPGWEQVSQNNDAPNERYGYGRQRAKPL